MRIRRFGPKKPAGQHLNIVMVTKRFGGIAHFREFVKKLVNSSHFRPHEPHFFLFTETPFPQKYFPDRPEVKKEIREIAAELKRMHPHSHVAFSINEHTTRRSKRFVEGSRHHSNTGYVVGANGYLIYPKMEKTLGERLALRELVGSVQKEYPRWSNRASRVFERKQNPFPVARIEKTGHSIEYRVCGDARLSKHADNNLITAISAHELPPEYLERGRKMLVINDSSPKYGQQIILPNGIIVRLDKLTEFTRKDLREIIREHKLRFYIVGE